METQMMVNSCVKLYFVKLHFSDWFLNENGIIEMSEQLYLKTRRFTSTSNWLYVRTASWTLFFFV